ncbi:MAG: hypothetical protein AVDCRST_MAG02-1657, partial [uncultured Rubrobacteraceae bacterium]
GFREQKAGEGRPGGPAPGVRPRGPRRRPGRRPAPDPARREARHRPGGLGEHAQGPDRLRQSATPLYRTGL